MSRGTSGTSPWVGNGDLKNLIFTLTNTWIQGCETYAPLSPREETWTWTCWNLKPKFKGPKGNCCFILDRYMLEKKQRTNMFSVVLMCIDLQRLYQTYSCMKISSHDINNMSIHMFRTSIPKLNLVITLSSTGSFTKISGEFMETHTSWWFQPP